MNANSLGADVLAEHTKDILQAVDRRLDVFAREQAIKRKELTNDFKALLNQQRSDVLADVAKLMQATTA